MTDAAAKQSDLRADLVLEGGGVKGIGPVGGDWPRYVRPCRSYEP